MQKYKLASDYYEKYGNLLVPKDYVTKEKVFWGIWIERQRKRLKDGRISNIEIQLLNDLDMIWNLHESE